MGIKKIKIKKNYDIITVFVLYWEPRKQIGGF
jgi:hypothetical protein